MKREKGFSLLEVLITLLILAFIVGGIFSVLWVSDISWDSVSGTLDVQQAVRQAMQNVTRELRQARPSDVTILNAGRTVTFRVPLDNNIPPNYSQLITYDLSGAQIIRNSAGINYTLANDITSLIFSRSGAEVTIQIGAQKTVRQKTYSWSLTEKARLRNE